MKKILLLIPFLVACDCKFESKLNICVWDDSGIADWTQADFTEWENAFSSVSGVTWFNRPVMVAAAKTPTFMCGLQSARGCSFCPSNSVIINNGRPEFSSISHEMFHILQGCVTAQPNDPGQDDYHSDWERTGVNAKLLAIQSRLMGAVK